MSGKRKTFVAREDLTKRISEMAKRRGYSLYDMVNEVFELTVKAEDAGVNLRNAVEEHEVLKTAKEAGFILCLESLWYDMAEFAYEKAKSKTVKSWFNAGVWLAKRYVTSEIEDPFEAFKRDLEAFTWNAPEFNIEKTEKEVSVRIISSRFPESYTLMYLAFLDGILETFGYKIVDAKVSSISGDVATVKTTITTLEGKITAIDGNVATIETSVGTIQADVTDILDKPGVDMSPVWIAVVLSLVAAIAAAFAVITIRQKIAG